MAQGQTAQWNRISSTGTDLRVCGHLMIKVTCSGAGSTGLAIVGGGWWLFATISHHTQNYLERDYSALAGVARWIACWPADWKVTSVPSQGTRLGCGPKSPVGGMQDTTNRCISHLMFSPSLSPSLPLSLKRNKENLFKKWAIDLFLTPKGYRFDSGSQHIPKLRFPSLVRVCTEGNWTISLSPPPPSSVSKINKHILRWGILKRHYNHKRVSKLNYMKRTAHQIHH